ncbi:adenylate/guanylate cyclase domain-containing protein [Gordonia hankookensis]|uniref:Adenylate/guanylate cyclase domain-containing protein n=1 Tax=Gordonia hankookensis TaxID=589403 RepID=A0ABR7WIB1_9ACTN|nr:adenylate/guanylate cyclase domain-containing protein [Gordonia hankookensis]MBD1322243.1 adenylate/guanylate cyclase domain-containing protein [Gordonia hankookensis]
MTGTDGDAAASGEQRDDRPAAARPSRRAADALARSDANAGAVRAARAARSLLPDSRSAPSGGRTSDRVARLIGESRPDRPSVVRELGLGAVQVWQSLVSRRTVHDDNPVPATILFTDLVGFSTWALGAGDDQVLRLLAQVNDVTESVVTARAGSVVKQLGDGSMAVFLDGTEAIEAGYEAICAVSALTIDGYRPQLRAGLHTGTPRAVGDDFLGVDVNIAARVADAAGPGELLVSDATLASADAEKYHRRRRRFKAKGVPRDLEVFAVVPRYDSGA